jgi:phosphoribosylaminoimidazole-succinocarboxamide synthase
MLAALGFLTVIALLVGVMTKKMSPTGALIVIPVITGVIASFFIASESGTVMVWENIKALGGYITGSGWASYKKNGTVCGIKLPEGLSECDKLPEPIYTPSTKAEIGDHDENISFEQSIDVLEKQFPGHGVEYAEKLRDCTIALYKKCADYALSRGIIIADTKFEFGLDENGVLTLGDEMLTPDSSRFWPLEGYREGVSQPSYDKQYVRDYLKAHPDAGLSLPEDVIEKTILRYKEAYELLVDKNIVKK